MTLSDNDKRESNRQSSRRWYSKQENREKVSQTTRNNRRENKKKAIAYKGGRCEHCKRTFSCPQVYDFHHEDPTQKAIPISSLTHLAEWDPSKCKEIDKCILLCANCHRIEHERLRGGEL